VVRCDTGGRGNRAAVIPWARWWWETMGAGGLATTAGATVGRRRGGRHVGPRSLLILSVFPKLQLQNSQT
jgi:hypothetical protein